jgi:hypothetical protein
VRVLQRTSDCVQNIRFVFGCADLQSRLFTPRRSRGRRGGGGGRGGGRHPTSSRSRRHLIPKVFIIFSHPTQLLQLSLLFVTQRIHSLSPVSDHNQLSAVQMQWSGAQRFVTHCGVTHIHPLQRRQSGQVQSGCTDRFGDEQVGAAPIQHTQRRGGGCR